MARGFFNLEEEVGRFCAFLDAGLAEAASSGRSAGFEVMLARTLRTVSAVKAPAPT
jgi:hypothetical protein